jgi:hypothetical protein
MEAATLPEAVIRAAMEEVTEAAMEAVTRVVMKAVIRVAMKAVTQEAMEAVIRALLPCKSHGHRVCQQLWLRDKYLAQRLSIHHQIF